MKLAIAVMWILWMIPAIMYIVWKRNDWYLFIFPPTVITIIALVISIFSEVVGIIAIIAIHIYIIVQHLFLVKR